MTSLSSQERTVIQTLLELNYSVRAIARFIKRSPSAVSIEIHQVTPYKAEIAHALAENEVYESFAGLVQGKSAIFISHRLASTRFCDRIIFLADGKITAQGTHEELMAQGGGYAEMYRVQSKYYQKNLKSGDDHD